MLGITTYYYQDDYIYYWVFIVISIFEWISFKPQ